jgi:hypothetical protein
VAARLPTPGKDSGQWGNILNDFLSQVHNANGTLKDSSVGSAQLQDGAVVSSAIADDSITLSHLNTGLQSSLSKADSAYQKPGTGVPLSDLKKGDLDAQYAIIQDGRVPSSQLPTLYRTTAQQPFASDSIWNTPVGSAAIYESSSSTATASLLASSPAINDTLNGYGFYINVAMPSDPLGTGSYTDSTSGTTYTFTHRMPYQAVISSGTDKSMRIIDGRFAYDYWKATKVNDLTYSASYISQTDLLGSGIGSGTRAAKWPTAGGLVRTYELVSCYIPHALAMSIPAAALKRGFVWPALSEDALTVTYSGEVPMGSFFAIPSTIDITTLGLSPEGYALAECLQNYGAYIGDQSGSAAIFVEGEAALTVRPALERMRTDWTAMLFPLLRRVTNVSTGVPGGPGTRRAAASGPITIDNSPLTAQLDQLRTRMRAMAGSMMTSESCKTAAATPSSTDTLLGGTPLSWSGTPAQFQIAGGVLKRVDSPDGSSRAITLDTGIRDVRIEAIIATLPTSGTLSIMAGATSINSAYRVTINADGSAALSKIISGTVTTLSGTTIAAGSIIAGSHVGLMLYGPRLFMLVNGEVMAEITDTDLTTNRLCGFTFGSSNVPSIREITVHSVPRLIRVP